MSSLLSSLVKNLPGSSSSLVAIDPNNPSVLQTLHSGDVIASRTVLAFDPDSGLLVISGSAGVSEMYLPSLVMGSATKITVMVLPRAIMTPPPTASAGSGIGSYILSGLGADTNDPTGSNLPLISSSGPGDASATSPAGNRTTSSTSTSGSKKHQPSWVRIFIVCVLSLLGDVLHFY